MKRWGQALLSPLVLSLLRITEYEKQDAWESMLWEETMTPTSAQDASASVEYESQRFSCPSVFPLH